MGLANYKSVLILFMFFLVSCTNADKKNANHGAIAKAYDQYLYIDDLEMPTKNSNPADSLNELNDQINTWLISNIINEQSKTQLPTSIRREIEVKVDAYRNELYGFAYAHEITAQKMDTTIIDSIINKYYDKYISNYYLDQAYLRFLYVKCDKKEFVEEVESWIKDSIDIHNLEDFCKEELQACHLKQENWVSLRQFKSRLANVNLDMDKVQTGNTYFKIKDDNVHYLLRILEYKDKDEPAPLSFVKNDIQTILLNKKKVDFFNSLKQDLLKKELDKGNIKIFE